MSALDDIFFGFDEVFEASQKQTILRARAEIAQLRDTVSGLADMAKQLGIEHTLVAQLRDDLQVANDELAAYSKLSVILNASSAADVVGAVDALYTELRMSHERIAEQARQLEEARELLITLDRNDWNDRVDAWIAAHPAPQTAPKNAPRHFDMCPCVAAEHPVKPCSNGCWHFTPDGGHQCVNCGQPSAPKPDKAQ